MRWSHIRKLKSISGPCLPTANQMRFLDLSYCCDERSFLDLDTAPLLWFGNRSESASWRSDAVDAREALADVAGGLFLLAGLQALAQAAYTKTYPTPPHPPPTPPPPDKPPPPTSFPPPHPPPPPPPPSRPIKMIVPIRQAGPTDFRTGWSRNPLQERLARNVVVENRPGAAIKLGVEKVAKAAPDGATRC